MQPLLARLIGADIDAAVAEDTRQNVILSVLLLLLLLLEELFLSLFHSVPVRRQRFAMCRAHVGADCDYYYLIRWPTLRGRQTRAH